MNDYQQKLSQYITALNKIQNKASSTQAIVDSLFALRNNEILADDWSKSGSLTQGFKIVERRCWPKKLKHYLS